MGNKGSTDTPGGLTSSQQREENQYDYPPVLNSITRPSPSVPTPSPAPPAAPRTSDHRSRAHGIERRSMTVVERNRERDQRSGHSMFRRLSTSDATLPPDALSQQDTLEAHIVDSVPRVGEEDVDLAVVISVTFDKDVRTVNVSKLFEVKCDLENIDTALKPVKGRCTYDGKTQKAEFISQNTLHPSATYTVTLLGRAVTTTQCSSGASISNAQFTFTTCNPPPKNIGIKMKGENGEVERLQIANHYDLYNSLIVWSTRQWGCSGEHVTGLFVEGEERGRLQALKADHDVLHLRENDIVVVEIKD